MINRIYADKDLKDDIGTKIKFVGHNDIDIDGMTIHKSKGLTADEVILIGLDNYFPNSRYYKSWFEELFRPIEEFEPISYPEERRLFYVALTRTKNYVYLLVNENPKYRSPFISELYLTMKKEDEKVTL